MDQHVKFIASSVVLLVFLSCGVSAENESYVQFLENSDYIEKLKLLIPEKLFTNYDNADDEARLKSTCIRDLLILEEAIRRREIWALTMLDASSKLPSGLLQGNLIDFGQYDECLAVHSNSTKYDIRGRHCKYSISPTQGNVTMPINPTLSVCLPATCSPNDIVSFFNTAILRNDNLKDLKIQIVSATCSPVDPIIWDLEFTLCIAILACLITFLVTCTIIELCHKNLAANYDDPPFVGTLAKFSLRKSATSILNMEIKEGSLPAIHGLRFFNMAWAVLAHEYLFSITSAMANIQDFTKSIQSWNSLYFFLALYAVDIFLAMSGFLMTYQFLKQMPKQKRFNVPMYYFHRYYRLTPPMIALIAITVVILPKLGSGPQWDDTMNIFAESCRTKLWSHIFYLHNFVEKDSMCLFHLWYLAVDMQLIWISPLILYPLYKTPKFGLSILTALIFASLVFPAVVIGIRQLPVWSFTHLFGWNVIMEIFGDNIYINPFHRAGAWLVGIFFGYDVAMHNRQLNRWAVITGWSTAIASLSFCILGMRSFMDPDYEYNVVWEAFYSAVSRPIWAFGVCWIMYACIKNCAGPLSSILSSRIFLPFNKISYSVYLVHICLLAAHAGSLRRPMYFSVYYVWRSFLSTLVMSIGAAFLFTLLFESPTVVLEKMLLERKRESHSKHKEN